MWFGISGRILMALIYGMTTRVLLAKIETVAFCVDDNIEAEGNYTPNL